MSQYYQCESSRALKKKDILFTLLLFGQLTVEIYRKYRKREQEMYDI